MATQKMSMAEIRKLAKKQSSGRKSSNFKNSDIYPFWQMNEEEEAVIRILPNKTEENHPIPMIEKKQHRLAIDGKDRNVVCPQTFGNQCPICDLSQEYYRSEGKDSKNGKYYWRDLKHICRAVVIKDPLPPDSETGETFENKVVTLQLGFQLHKKIEAQLADFFDDDDPLPWDLENGFNFKIKKTMQGGRGKYDLASTFERKPSEIPTEALENIELKELEEFLPPEVTYEETDELLQKHLNGGVGAEDSLENKRSSSESSSKRREILNRLGGNDDDDEENEEELDEEMKNIVEDVQEESMNDENNSSHESDSPIDDDDDDDDDDEDSELAAIIARRRKSK
jgi:hypothetical protein